MYAGLSWIVKKGLSYLIHLGITELLVCVKASPWLIGLISLL